jgi:hypothetical protein
VDLDDQKHLSSLGVFETKVDFLPLLELLWFEEMCWFDEMKVESNQSSLERKRKWISKSIWDETILTSFLTLLFSTTSWKETNEIIKN